MLLTWRSTRGRRPTPISVKLEAADRPAPPALEGHPRPGRLRPAPGLHAAARRRRNRKRLSRGARRAARSASSTWTVEGHWAGVERWGAGATEKTRACQRRCNRLGVNRECLDLADDRVFQRAYPLPPPPAGGDARSRRAPMAIEPERSGDLRVDGGRGGRQRESPKVELDAAQPLSGGARWPRRRSPETSTEEQKKKSSARRAAPVPTWVPVSTARSSERDCFSAIARSSGRGANGCLP